MALTSDDLIDAVQRQGFLPETSDLTSTDILALADAEMADVLSMLEKDSRQEYGVVTHDFPLTTALSYRLPRRALARTVRSVSLLNTDEREVPCEESPAALPTWQNGDQWSRTFFFEGDTINFRSAPDTGWTLRVRYERRPSQLVPVASCAAISSCTDSSTLVLVSASLPAGITSTKNYVDIVRGDAPHDVMYADAITNAGTLPSVGLLNVTLDPTQFVNLATVTNDRIDYLCPRDQTCYPPLAETGFPVLVAAVTRRVLEVIGDRAGATVAEATLMQRVKAHLDMIAPRNEQGSRAIVNRSSPLRGSPLRGRRWPR